MPDEEKIITPEETKRILEAVLFAAGHPDDLCQAF